MIDIHALPFDQYQRYRLVADLLVKALDGKRGRILDVGGRTELLGGFLEGHDIVLVDVESSDASGLILGSGAALPFADDSFDAVCAFDTLEHVPVDLRDAFVSECARVSRGFVFLAGPYDSPDVARSEELLQEFLKHKIGKPHRYLNEHRVLGLPDRARVTSILEQAGGQVGVVGHANLERWLLAMCLEMYMESDPLLQPLAKPFYRFYNRLVYPHDHAGPVYRHVVMASFAGQPLPTSEDVLEASELPKGTETLLQTFAKDWMAVDREHQHWKPEFARLTGIIADLEKDLGEHKQALDVGGEDLRAHKETLIALRADFEGYSEASANQLHGLNTELQAHRDQAIHLEATLKEQAEGGAQALQDQRSVYEAALTEARLQGESVQSDLGAELQRTREHAAALEAERERARACIADLEGERERLHGHAHGLGEQVQGLGQQVQGLVDQIHGLENEVSASQARLASAHAALRSWTHALGRVFGRKFKE